MVACNWGIMEVKKHVPLKIATWLNVLQFSNFLVYNFLDFDKDIWKCVKFQTINNSQIALGSLVCSIWLNLA